VEPTLLRAPGYTPWVRSKVTKYLAEQLPEVYEGLAEFGILPQSKAVGPALEVGLAEPPDGFPRFAKEQETADVPTAYPVKCLPVTLFQSEIKQLAHLENVYGKDYPLPRSWTVKDANGDLSLWHKLQHYRNVDSVSDKDAYGDDD